MKNYKSANSRCNGKSGCSNIYSNKWQSNHSTTQLIETNAIRKFDIRRCHLHHENYAVIYINRKQSSDDTILLRKVYVQNHSDVQHPKKGNHRQNAPQ